jgi:hypothetical protein
MINNKNNGISLSFIIDEIKQIDKMNIIKDIIEITIKYSALVSIALSRLNLIVDELLFAIYIINYNIYTKNINKLIYYLF